MFSQFSFNGKQWVSPDGKRAILPKSNGMGIMISAFQSREFGFGLELTPEQLKAINDYRKLPDHCEYFDKKAAEDVYGTAKKPELKTSPFVVEFEFGGANGYWTGSHTFLQTEDCVDCLRVLFGYKYDYVFLFDSSSGHCRARDGGLNAKDLNKSWGGSLKVRASVLVPDLV